MTDADLVDRARSVAEREVAPRAAEIDEHGTFPAENLRGLHAAGLMGVFLPRSLGGPDASVRCFAEIAAVLGGACASTALVWAMHGQQLASLVDHAAVSHVGWLERVARHGRLIGSVTTDREGGAELGVTGQPLVVEGDRLRLRRDAPVVTGGAHAAFHLVTMRAGPDSPPTATRLVAVAAENGTVEELGAWDAMGMRGTHSVPMRFDVLVEPGQVLDVAFGELARRTMVPVGHVGWAAAWLGVARGCFQRVCAAVRGGTFGGGVHRSDVLFERLAEARLDLDLLESIVVRTADEVDRCRRDGGVPDTVLVNNVKLAGARLSLRSVNTQIELVGMRGGYRRHGSLGLERAYRDLRAAGLMYHDDRLRMANGRLVLAPGMSLRGADREAALR